MTYRNYPFDIADSYSRFEVVNKLDIAAGDSVKVAEIKTDIVDDIFSGTDLQKSGSIFRGFPPRNGRDLTLQWAQAAAKQLRRYRYHRRAYR